MSGLLRSRDPSIVDELWSDGFRLVGSEVGEMATSREQLVALFRKLFTRTVRYAFDFPIVEVDVDGNVAWLFAEGALLADDGEKSERLPYRLTAVFTFADERWRWRLFSGAEPAPSLEAP
ncbi:hypothetical protein BJF92_02265 [Rhizobium rhizosphaerae]|uniref:SnoaL-like domain-containing protein n=1 Tax=Xaviernesmea rhizosphaerae TaxID=1672749 RepID=A0A1Q9AKW5_9HYPH|nr:nuclear transport factor 2 family protein [Xaviernesmea rhizosphaerae]OLP55956.1 hypothetical protein BJF92_02265 [Xaviernesmea rhizosphaerae]